MVVLGINEGINSSVVVAERGQIRFAVQEERIRRVKEFVGFPDEALRFTFRYLGLDPADVEAVCLSNLVSPGFTKAEFLAAYDRNAEQTVEELTATPGVVFRIRKTRLLPERKKTATEEPHPHNVEVERKLAEHGLKARVVRTHHHLNHAAAAYFGLRADPETPHLVLSLDGGGDDACAHVYRAERGELHLLAETPVGHSIGNLYSRVTHFMGMTPHEHEYKLMGLAAYAKPEYCANVIEVFRGYLGLDPEDPMKFRSRLPVPTTRLAPFLARDLRRVRFDNLAGGLQFFTEELLLEWVKKLVAATGIRKVLGTGGVFMNVKANQRLAALEELEFFDVFPSCGDETLPFGAVWQHFAEHDPQRGRDIRFETLGLGPDPRFDLEPALCEFEDRVQVERLEDPERSVAELIASGEVVARCSGPLEFGARALGNRTITADPSRFEIVARINRMIKQRDFWMPFAPAVMLEEAHRFLQVPPALPSRISPFMMHTFETTDRRDEFVAGVHAYDHTSRAQVVSPASNEPFHRLIAHFRELKGKGIVLNTSFNLHGFPIVTGTKDALEVLLQSDLSHLVVEDRLITKRC